MVETTETRYMKSCNLYHSTHFQTQVVLSIALTMLARSKNETRHFQWLSFKEINVRVSMHLRCHSRKVVALGISLLCLHAHS